MSATKTGSRTTSTTCSSLMWTVSSSKTVLRIFRRSLTRSMQNFSVSSLRKTKYRKIDYT